MGLYNIKYQNAENNKKKPKFKLGDTVRIWLKRTAFHRGYYENYTREYFKIDKILTNLPVPRYKLKDILDENIEGTFFEDELVLYTPTNDVYNIEKIIQTMYPLYFHPKYLLICILSLEDYSRLDQF